jgi:hypothetical protein
MLAGTKRRGFTTATAGCLGIWERERRPHLRTFSSGIMVTCGAAAAVLFSGSWAYAQDEDVHGGIRVREWFSRMEGTIQSNSGSTSGTRASIAHDLDLGDRTLAHEVQASVGIPAVGGFYAGAWWDHVEGHRTLTQDVTFLLFTFPSSTDVSTSADLDVFYLSYEYPFPRIILGDGLTLDFGLQAGARGLKARGSIAESGGTSSSDQALAGFPVLGGHATLDVLSWVRAQVEIAAIAFSYSNYRVRYLEVNSEVGVEPLPWIYAGIGYKFADIHLGRTGSNGFNFDVGLSGLYITVGLRF